MTEVTLDHELLMSSLHTESERALATSALGMHPGTGLRVLVGGLGLGYTAHAALEAERVGEVRVIERLPEVIRWMREGLVPLAAALRDDPRLRIEGGDVYAHLAGAVDQEFDLILIDVDHSPDEPLAPDRHAFHDTMGLEAAKTHLAPGGILGVWSSTANQRFAQSLERVFESVHAKEITFLNRHEGRRQSDWLYFAGPLRAGDEPRRGRPIG